MSGTPCLALVPTSGAIAVFLVPIHESARISQNCRFVGRHQLHRIAQIHEGTAGVPRDKGFHWQMGEIDSEMSDPVFFPRDAEKGQGRVGVE